MGRFFGNRWWVAIASACGLLVGAGAINVFAFGVFLKPVTEDLGVSRGVFSAALLVNTSLNAAACPVFGWLIDRYGTRRVMIPGIILCAIATAGYSLMQGSPGFLIPLIFALSGVVSVVQNPIGYAAVTSQWFDTNRGLALGIAMAGVGLGVALIPQLASFLILHFGWRAAYIGLSVAIMILAFLPVAIFLREPPELMQREKAHQAATDALPGVTLAAAMKQWRFWALTIAFLLGVVAINGTLTQIVALLTDRGVPLQLATATLSAAGLAIIAGRILSGWCLDRFNGSIIAIFFFILPMVGIGLLLSGAAGLSPLVGAALCGLGIGAEVDLMAFFVGRYFGLKAFARIYGTMFMLFLVGTGGGPALSGKTFDVFHSYSPILWAFEFALAITCLLFLRLGPYPYPAGSKGRRA